MALQRPTADEHAPYYGNYTALVPEGDVRDHLRVQLAEMLALVSGLSESRASYAYGPGKWTLKEVVLHIIDAERVFAYRMLRIARGDTTPLPGFEQNDWVPLCGAAGRSVASLMVEYSAVRAATLVLMDALEPGAWLRRGTASGHPVSARALAYIIAGHDRHHQKILRDRYLAT
ncbi:MAG TPA: DinB family protein [Gemmatimonadaceae bacterium]|nr:DinB family protein [Gemmatimonadaceae bacterium]